SSNCFVGPLCSPWRATVQATSPIVLVVEDDPWIRGLLEDVLGEEYVVESCNRGLDGLARLERASVDLMLLDLRLPDVDGLEVCRQVGAQGLQDRHQAPP